MSVMPPMLPDFYIHHEKGHTWSMCGGCGLMVLCGTCNNNCCNGGYGEVEGKECPDCPSAYEFQKEYKEEAETYYALDINRWLKQRNSDD